MGWNLALCADAVGDPAEIPPADVTPGAKLGGGSHGLLKDGLLALLRTPQGPRAVAGREGVRIAEAAAAPASGGPAARRELAGTARGSKRMNGTTDFDGRLLTQLLELAAARTHFRTEAIQVSALRRLASSRLALGQGLEELLRQAGDAESALVQSLLEEVLVGETYFFRQPEHFEYIATQLVPAALDAGRGWLRAWSAGCATGEEAYPWLPACWQSCPPRWRLPRLSLSWGRTCWSATSRSRARPSTIAGRSARCSATPIRCSIR